MNNLSILARRLVILTSVGVGGSYLLTHYMPNQETAPQRHNHLLNWVNLGCDKIYYHAGSAVRGYILSDPESAHERAVDVTSKSKLVRGILGLRPPLFDYANLHSEPFQEKERQKNKENQGKPSETSVPLKRLHFWNPVGLAAGSEHNSNIGAVEGSMAIQTELDSQVCFYFVLCVDHID